MRWTGISKTDASFYLPLCVKSLTVGGKKKATQLPGWLVRKGQGSKTPASLQWQKSLLEQCQHRLGGLVGLGQHGSGCLLDDLRLGQVGGLLGVVGVQDAAA